VILYTEYHQWLPESKLILHGLIHVLLQHSEVGCEYWQFFMRRFCWRWLSVIAIAIGPQFKYRYCNWKLFVPSVQKGKCTRKEILAIESAVKKASLKLHLRI
jgi:hypothetical protein